MTKRKTRKPREINFSKYLSAEVCGSFYDHQLEMEIRCAIVVSGIYGLKTKEARKLAAWLIKAADYLDDRGSK